MQADDQQPREAATENARLGDTAACATEEPLPSDVLQALFSGEGKALRIAEFDAAIERHSASYTQLGAAIFFSREKFNSDMVERGVYQRYIAPLTGAFEAAHGPITHSFYCQQVIGAAVLTGRQELWVIPPALDPEWVPIAELLFECDRLKVEADRVLSGPERIRDLQATKTLIYEVVVKLLSLIDSRTKPTARGILDLHRRELKRAHEYYLRAAARYAQFDYFRGMLIGLGVSLGMIVIGASVGVHFMSSLDVGTMTLLGCLIAGGAGAVVSVMSRMTFGGLSLDYEAGRRLLTMLGAFRPAIGMALGAAMWVLTASGVLAVVPNDPAKIPFFRILTAFLAGFSERWAQDMLRRTENHISGRGTQA